MPNILNFSRMTKWEVARILQLSFLPRARVDIECNTTFAIAKNLLR